MIAANFSNRSSSGMDEKIADFEILLTLSQLFDVILQLLYCLL